MFGTHGIPYSVLVSVGSGDGELSTAETVPRPSARKSDTTIRKRTIRAVVLCSVIRLASETRSVSFASCTDKYAGHSLPRKLSSCYGLSFIPPRRLRWFAASSQSASIVSAAILTQPAPLQ